MKRQNFLFLLLLNAPAFCGEFLTSGGSARSAGTAGVYAPSGDNVLDAMAINPAGLALVNAPMLDLTLLGGLATGDYTNKDGLTSHLHSIGGLPYGAFGMPLPGGRVTFGVAALPEMLSSAKWNYTDPAGGAGAVSYGQLRGVSAITAVRTAFGVGVYLSKRVQVGATIGSTYNRNELTTAYVFQNYAPLAGLKTLLNLHTSGHGWNGTAGVLVEASRRLQLGFGYHSQTTITSTGEAAGNAGKQFAALGLGGARPDFRYDAEVDNVLPQSVNAGATWQATSKLQLMGQAEWVNWGRAFRTLPVILTNGNNADINGLLGTNAFRDDVPVEWRDQAVIRVGVARRWSEHGSLRAGYAHANSPVPGSTLSPFTAAITRNTLSAGAGYGAGRWRFDVAYTVDPRASESTGRSALKAGEFDNSNVSVGMQSVVLSTSFRLR